MGEDGGGEPLVSAVASLNSTYNGNVTNTTAIEVEAAKELTKVEEVHEFDAVTSLLINVTLISCFLMAYAVKKYRLYYLPESAGAIVVGMIVGGMARLILGSEDTDNLLLFEFVSYEVMAYRTGTVVSFVIEVHLLA